MPIGEVGRDPVAETNNFEGQLLMTPLKADLEYIANYILKPDQQPRILGEGAFGQTFLFSRKAVKRIKLKTPHAYDNFVSEVGVWEVFSGIPDLVPFIPKYLGSRVFPADASRNIAIGIIIQEYEEVSSLEDYIELWDKSPLSGNIAYKLIMNIKQGFDLMHANGYIHRDIKPANMLIRKGKLEMPIIIDFGLVCLKPCMKFGLAGTPLYTPLNALKPSMRGEIGQRAFPVVKKKGFFDTLFRRKNVIKKFIIEKTQTNKIDPIYNDAWDNYSVSLVIAEIYDVTNWEGLEQKKGEVENLINRLSSQIIPFLAARKRRENLKHIADEDIKKGDFTSALNVLNVIPEENNVLKAELGAAPAAGGRRTRRNRHKKSKRRISRKYKQRAGGDRDYLKLRTAMMIHEDISRIGPAKPVATPLSGPDVWKFVDIWHGLDESNRQKLKDLYLKSEGWELGIYEHPHPPVRKERWSGNMIIFYSVNYLQKLAEASDKSIDELLTIFANPLGNGPRLHMDLIRIAFGDDLEKDPLESEEGELILAKYQSML